MASFKERIVRARLQGEAQVATIASEIKSIKLTASDLNASIQDLKTVNLTERDPIARIVEALDLLRNKLHGNHQEVNAAIKILQFVKVKMGEDLPLDSLRAFRTIVSREYLPNALELRNQINSACADLIKIVEAEFRIEHTMSKDLELLHSKLSQLAGQVSEL